MSIKNGLIRLALKLLPIQKFHEEVPRRILIVSTTALGDTLWATPALTSLRNSFPSAQIAVLTSPIGMHVLKHNPNIDQLYLYRNLPSLWLSLRRQKFDTALIFHASQRLPLPLVVAAGIPRIVGTAGLNKGLDFLLTHSLPNHYQHEIMRRLQMVETIGGTISSETLSFFLQPEERKIALSGFWIAIHPGSKDLFKRWPPEHFAKVGRALQTKFDCRIMITGTEEERPLMEQIAEQIPGSQTIQKGLSLRQFAALLEKMSLLISNDTGPVHLACALSLPVVALYSSTQPDLCGPHRASQAIAIVKKATCHPCLKKKCSAPFCFLQIGTEEVLAAATKLLEESI